MRIPRKTKKRIKKIYERLNYEFNLYWSLKTCYNLWKHIHKKNSKIVVARQQSKCLLHHSRSTGNLVIFDEYDYSVYIK